MRHGRALCLVCWFSSRSGLYWGIDRFCPLSISCCRAGLEESPHVGEESVAHGSKSLWLPCRPGLILYFCRSCPLVGTARGKVSACVLCCARLRGWSPVARGVVMLQLAGARCVLLPCCLPGSCALGIAAVSCRRLCRRSRADLSCRGAVSESARRDVYAAKRKRAAASQSQEAAMCCPQGGPSHRLLAAMHAGWWIVSAAYRTCKQVTIYFGTAY